MTKYQFAVQWGSFLKDYKEEPFGMVWAEPIKINSKY